MKDELTLMRLIPGERQEVFGYFVTPHLLEQWAYPDGMTLKIPLLEARPNGHYCETGWNQCLDNLSSLLVVGKKEQLRVREK